MKSILKKIAGVAVAAVLALGMFSCSNGISDDPVKETVATPVFSVVSGAVNSGTEVTISCATKGAKIYYTTDGTDPTEESKEYSNAISITKAVTLRAIAVKSGMNDSAVASASYTIKGTVATPAFSPDSGAVNSGTKVTISYATEGAKIYYTTDGNEPTAESTEYTGAAISITEAVTLKAIAVKDGMNNSAVASVSYTIKETVATPAFSPASGAVNSGTKVTISCVTEGAKIYYTTDGNEPTASSTEYTDAISVTAAVTLKAIAVKDDLNDSAVESASYLIIPTKATCVPGDFVLKDGTMLPKDITLTKTQKSNVAAVVVRAAGDGKRALIVGIFHSRLVWCESSAMAYKTNITALQGNTTSGYMDGRDGWEKLKTACRDLSNDEKKYPAWSYCNGYGWNNLFSIDIYSGWYLPTVAELYTIYQNKTAVDASLEKAGGNQFGKNVYWSCCQDSSRTKCAMHLDFEKGNMNSSSKDYYLGYYVCSVRVL